MRGGVSELQSPCFTAVRAEIALMSGSVSAGPITRTEHEPAWQLLG
jgi:hypothetical protein